MTHYILATGQAIFGTGDSPEAAHKDAQQWGEFPPLDEIARRNPRDGSPYIVPATDALIAQVKAHGGDIAWNDSGPVADVRTDD